MLEKNIEKVLYLNVNMLCLKNLNALYQTKLRDKMLAGCSDYDEMEACQRLSLRNERYFNEAVMLLNLEKWRRDHFTEILLQCMESHKLKCKSSQDLLNKVLDGDFIRLRQHYNYPVDGVNECERALEAVILRYENFLKFECENKGHTYIKVYREYAKQSLWADRFEAETGVLQPVLLAARSLAKAGKYQEAIYYYETVLQNGILQHSELER